MTTSTSIEVPPYLPRFEALEVAEAGLHQIMSIFDAKILEKEIL